MAADRVAQGREGTDKVLAVDLAADYRLCPSGRSGQIALAHRARLSGTEAGTRPRTLRGPRLAWLPSSRHALHRCLRIPDLREGDDSPLGASPRLLATFHSRKLPTPWRRPRGLSATPQTPSPPCADD